VISAYRPRLDTEQLVRSYFHRPLVDRDLSVCEELLTDDPDLGDWIR
jgi:hypothetical protein